MKKIEGVMLKKQRMPDEDSDNGDAMKIVT